ncbi:hypothetical protein AMTRI_Chr08g166150 [Amborella trichopoda]
MAVQDPSYTAYVDSRVIICQTVAFQKDVEKYGKIEYMKCTPENELVRLVQFAKDNGSIIVYGSAYAMYISDDCPRAIFEIPGAKAVAISISSFSKYAGFTGVGLGWTVIPKQLAFSDGFPVAKDFNRIICTTFNGASNMAQAGGVACLSAQGLKAMHQVIGFNKENTEIIANTFELLGFKVYGGRNAPYAWVHFLVEVHGMFLQRFLRKLTWLQHQAVGSDQLVKVLLVSAFGHRENVPLDG